MHIIYKNLHRSVLIGVLILSAALAGCNDNVAGVEGFCPVVQSTNPENSAIDVDLSTEIVITFEERINTATITTASFTLMSAEVTPTVSSSRVAAANSKAVTRSVAGTVTETAPIPGRGAIRESLPLVTSPGDTQPVFLISEISGTIEFDKVGKQMTFIPDADLSPNTVYTGRLKNTVEDLLGNRMLEDYEWSFRTEDDPSSPFPRIESTVPQDGDVEVALNIIVSAMFTQEMNSSTINQTSFTLHNGTSLVNGTVSYSNLKASFVPDSNLVPETTYTATINSAAQNNLGVTLQNDFVWTFTTGEADAIVNPTVVSTMPQDGDVDVELNAVVNATFSQLMNPTTLNQSSFTLFNGANQVNGSVSYTNLTASFVPSSNLAPETIYTATITTAAQNNLGVALANSFSWSFTTDDEEAIANPMVVSTLPQDGAEEIALNVIVRASFSQLMNPNSLNASSFTLFDGNNQINGSVTYNNLTASFQPNSDLSPETTYTATITTAAENNSGNNLEEDYIWVFTTEDEEQVTPPPFLGLAERYGIMATAAITSTGNTVINGDVALDPGTSLTGFPPGVINGALNINNTESAAARADLLEAYNYFKGLPPGTTIPAGADLGALYPDSIAPGTYTSGSTMLVTTTLVLDAGGDVNAMWVFQIGSSLTTGSDIVLTGGANENNVYWVTTEDATVGVGSTFNGTIISGRDVTANTGAIINGRILAGAILAGTIALDANTVNVPGF
ncbi:MAG: Ig-like domain-containing protein [Balneolales bacterium]|nr:Ig-like domain-containing protein [Balneolales bacterium]